MSETKVPEIRFNKYKEAWVERRFADIVQRKTHVVTNADITVEYEDICSGYGTLNKDLRDKPFQKSGVAFESGDILFGKLRPYLKNWLNPDFEGAAVGDFWVLRGTETESSFLYNLIQGDAFTSVSSISSGSKMPRSDWGLVSQTPFMIPAELDEQNHIGSLFCSLDGVIAVHRKKLTKLQQTKTSLMQKMFPQDDADLPELRLEDFSGVWDRRRLGSLGTTYAGLSGKSKDDFGHGDARYVTYTDVFQNARILDASRCELVELDAKQNTVRSGDILFTVSSETPEEVGMSAVWLAEEANVYLNSFCFGLRPTVQLDSSFFAYLLRATAVRKQFTLLAQGISRFNISKKKAMDIEVRVPPVTEQQAIGSLFSALDHVIVDEKQYIEKLKQAKTSLLQQMYV